MKDLKLTSQKVLEEGSMEGASERKGCRRLGAPSNLIIV